MKRQDQNLLKYAANSLGKKWKWVSSPKHGTDKKYRCPGFHHRDSVTGADYHFPWNPLREDKDAFQLMIYHRVTVRFKYGLLDGWSVIAEYGQAGHTAVEIRLRDEDDTMEWVREAIVRVVALKEGYPA